MLSVRIVTADYYMSAPISGLDVTYSDFRASEVELVPVIRVFGSNPEGIKTCVHIHGVFPYIDIPYDSVEPHTKLACQIAVSLDKAINISLGNSNSQTKHVHKVVLVSGIPFYGYHGKEHQFLKIYFYKPNIVKKASSLLENGAVLNRVFQPHEAHVPFILQFFIDFNLYGMNYVHFAHGRYRRTGSQAMDSIPEELWLPETVMPVSVSQLEADVVSSDIINPTIKQSGSGVVNPGLAAIWDDEKQRRADDGVTETPRLHSQRRPLPPTDSDLYYRRKITAKLESLQELTDSMSGKSSSGSRLSYPSETPAGSNILEASFVQVHSGQLDRPEKTTEHEPDMDETVVDEEVVRNLHSSQLSQRLNYSQLDEDDLELLMVMENLAHQTTQTVETDSVLGSQLSNSGEDVANVEPEVEDDDQEDWLDRTLVSDEVQAEAENRPDTPLIEENQQSQHSSEDRDFPWEDSFWNGVNSSYLLNEDKIPQLDGADDEEELPAARGRRRIGMRSRVPTGSWSRASRVVADAASTETVPEAPEPEAPEPEAPSSNEVELATQALVALHGGAEAPTENIVDLGNPQPVPSTNCAESILFGESGCGEALSFDSSFETPQGNSSLSRLAGAFNVPLDQGGLNLEEFCTSENSFLAELSNPNGGMIQSQMICLPSEVLHFFAERESEVASAPTATHVGDVAVLVAAGPGAQEENAAGEVAADASSSPCSSCTDPCSNCGLSEPLVSEETGLVVSAASFQDNTVLIGDLSLCQNSSPGRTKSSGNNDRSDSQDSESWFGVSDKDNSIVAAIARDCTPSRPAQGMSSKPIAFGRRSGRVRKQTMAYEQKSMPSLRSESKESSVGSSTPAASSTPVGVLSPEARKNNEESKDSNMVESSILSPCSCMEETIDEDERTKFEVRRQNPAFARNLFTKHSGKDFQRLLKNRTEEDFAGPSHEAPPSKEARTRELRKAEGEQQERRCFGHCSRALVQKGTLPSSTVPPLLWTMEDDSGDSDSDTTVDMDDPSASPRSKKKAREEGFMSVLEISQKILKLQKELMEKIRRNKLSLSASMRHIAAGSPLDSIRNQKKSNKVISRGKPKSSHQLRQLLECSVRLERLDNSSLMNLSAEHGVSADSAFKACSSPEVSVTAGRNSGKRKVAQPSVENAKKKGRPSSKTHAVVPVEARPASSQVQNTKPVVAASVMTPGDNRRRKQQSVSSKKTRSIFSSRSSPCTPENVTASAVVANQQEIGSTEISVVLPQESAAENHKNVAPQSRMDTSTCSQEMVSEKPANDKLKKRIEVIHLNPGVITRNDASLTSVDSASNSVLSLKSISVCSKESEKSTTSRDDAHSIQQDVSVVSQAEGTSAPVVKGVTASKPHIGRACRRKGRAKRGNSSVVQENLPGLEVPITDVRSTTNVPPTAHTPSTAHVPPTADTPSTAHVPPTADKPLTTEVSSTAHTPSPREVPLTAAVPPTSDTISITEVAPIAETRSAIGQQTADTPSTTGLLPTAEVLPRTDVSLTPLILSIKDMQSAMEKRQLVLCLEKTNVQALGSPGRDGARTDANQPVGEESTCEKESACSSILEGLTSPKKIRFGRLSLSARMVKNKDSPKRHVSTECQSALMNVRDMPSSSVQPPNNNEEFDRPRLKILSESHTPDVTPSKAKSDDASAKKSGNESSSKMTPLGEDIHPLKMTPRADLLESTYRQKQMKEQLRQICHLEWPSETKSSEQGSCLTPPPMKNPSGTGSTPPGRKQCMERKENSSKTATFDAPRRGRPRKTPLLTAKKISALTNSSKSVSDKGLTSVLKESVSIPKQREESRPGPSRGADTYPTAVKEPAAQVIESPLVTPTLAGAKNLTVTQTRTRTEKPVMQTLAESVNVAVTPISGESENSTVKQTLAQSDKPAVTQTPAESEKPAVTQTPAESEKPAVTQTPAESEKPAVTQIPAESEKPAVTQIPAESEKPAVTQTPAEFKEPAVVQTPARPKRGTPKSRCKTEPIIGTESRVPLKKKSGPTVAAEGTTAASATPATDAVVQSVRSSAGPNAGFDSVDVGNATASSVEESPDVLRIDTDVSFTSSSSEGEHALPTTSKNSTRGRRRLGATRRSTRTTTSRTVSKECKSSSRLFGTDSSNSSCTGSDNPALNAPLAKPKITEPAANEKGSETDSAMSAAATEVENRNVQKASEVAKEYTEMQLNIRLEKLTSDMLGKDASSQVRLPPPLDVITTEVVKNTAAKNSAVMTEAMTSATNKRCPIPSLKLLEAIATGDASVKRTSKESSLVKSVSVEASLKELPSCSDVQSSADEVKTLKELSSLGEQSKGEDQTETSTAHPPTRNDTRKGKQSLKKTRPTATSEPCTSGETPDRKKGSSKKTKKTLVTDGSRSAVMVPVGSVRPKKKAMVKMLKVSFTQLWNATRPRPQLPPSSLENEKDSRSKEKASGEEIVKTHGNSASADNSSLTPSLSKTSENTATVIEKIPEETFKPSGKTNVPLKPNNQTEDNSSEKMKVPEKPANPSGEGSPKITGESGDATTETIDVCDTTGSPPLSVELESDDAKSSREDDGKREICGQPEKTAQPTEEVKQPPSPSKHPKAISRRFPEGSTSCKKCGRVQRLNLSVSSDSTDESITSSSSSDLHDSGKKIEEKAPLDEDGSPMVVVKTGVGPASKTRKYVKANAGLMNESAPPSSQPVKDPKQSKSAEADISSTVSPEVAVVRSELSPESVVPEINSTVSSTTSKRPGNPILELSPKEELEIVSRKRQLQNTQSDKPLKRAKTDKGSSGIKSTTQKVGTLPVSTGSSENNKKSRAVRVRSSHEVSAKGLAEEKSSVKTSTHAKKKISVSTGSSENKKKSPAVRVRSSHDVSAKGLAGEKSSVKTSTHAEKISAQQKRKSPSMKSPAKASTRQKVGSATKKAKLSELTSTLDGTSIKISSMDPASLMFSESSRGQSEEVAVDGESKLGDDRVNIPSDDNSCDIETDPRDAEDFTDRAKKKLQFSLLSESSFEFEETKMDKNDMTLGLPLSPDEDIESSPRSSVDMFDNTVLETTLREGLSPSEKYVQLIPVMIPPSVSEVLASLPSLDIPETINPRPYFSNYQDVKKKKEVGGHILHLSSRNVVDLEEFRSSVVACSISDQQKALFELYLDEKSTKNKAKIASSLVSDRTVYITPVKRPPSVREVVLWDKARALLKAEKSPVKPKVATKTSAPRSPGGSQESDVSFSISQCSSIDIITPESTKSTQHSSSQSESRNSPQDLPPLKTSPIFRLRKSYGVRRKSRRLSVEPSLSDIKENPEDSRELSPDSQDSSLRRLLLNSQFRNQVSPQDTNISDISCLQIEGLDRSKDFRVPLENLQLVRNTSEHQYTTLLIAELHINVYGELKPDPERDPVRAVFYTVINDVPADSGIPRQLTGVIAVDSNSDVPLLRRIGIDTNVTYTTDEVSLVRKVIEFVREWDPDIIAGYEIEMLSWGYLIDRANTLGVNMRNELSRVVTVENPKQPKKPGMDSDEDVNFFGGLRLSGRIVIDVWRLMRHEVALQSYTFESITYHILHQRMPVHSFVSLSFWWEHSSHLYRWRTVQHYLNRVNGIARILEQLDFVGRTSELARLFGIQFFEVLSRGSQFRVESMMLRLAKPNNFVPVSPSVQQRSRMRAPEMLPLIMEPESRFYSDPVIVLDFQSLYPSMIIAYNYCFSTCLGRVEHLGKSSHYEFGCCHLFVPPRRLKKLQTKLTVSPCGVAFVTPEVRRGILPQMLEEILEARLAVKDSMKRHRDDRTLQRVLHARQLGLKLIANVTYGYTSANFSGRMPCIEIGDSVVSKGRETLERAITTVHSNPDWRARVVYGDTDSLFVLVPGRSREEAFRIGAEIAEVVTQDNPSPVKLKLEKVYQPCILQTKKRYVGYMYESPNQKEPVYDAKGIETVRRDGCPAVAKMLEKTLRILFETANVSLVKNYVCRQFTKMFKGRTNLQDFIYAKEYRGMANYRPGACVPALELTRRWLTKDRRSEPRISERVPYVIVNGPPGLPLIQLVRSPRDLLTDPSLRLNVVYYITRAIIPPLDRCLSLIGADALSWYSDLPRKKSYMYTSEGTETNPRKNTISQYFCTVECVCCGQLTNRGICVDCRQRPQSVAVQLCEKLHSWENAYIAVNKVCQSCIGSTEDVNCISLDCPILYRRLQASREYDHSNFVRRLKDECLHCG